MDEGGGNQGRWKKSGGRDSIYATIPPKAEDAGGKNDNQFCHTETDAHSWERASMPVLG